ncbi:MAG: hypothetical protein E7300_00460 [Lachnospiraceae bacterium]|jgi:hypothetical protein|nr:hypothetical protein [Lachnospiraceae bacterium]
MKKYVLSVLTAALGMSLLLGMSAFASNLPFIGVSDEEVKVSSQDPTAKVEITVSGWKYKNAFKLKWKIEDEDVCAVKQLSQNGDTVTLEVNAGNTGTTVVKFWLEGFTRVPKYMSVNTINYQKEMIDGYSVRHYGYMTGLNGEAARIDDLSVVKGALRVDFTLIDAGNGDGETATFVMRAEEEDGDPLATVQQECTGMKVGESGYKTYFKIPKKADVLRLLNEDI